MYIIHVYIVCLYNERLMMNNLLNRVFDTCVCFEAWAKLRTVNDVSDNIIIINCAI